MRRSHARPFCIIWLALAATLAHAAPALIDDSGTLPYNATLAMRWPPGPPRGPAARQLTGSLQLRVRLNVTPWLKHRGRIYMVLPAQQPGALHASWTTQGRLLPGELDPGSRALVYSGPITGPFIEDVVQLTVTVDSRRLSHSYPVNFHFEMDEG